MSDTLKLYLDFAFIILEIEIAFFAFLTWYALAKILEQIDKLARPAQPIQPAEERKP